SRRRRETSPFLRSHIHTFPPSFFFTDPPTTQIYTLSLHDALPICQRLADNASGKARELRPIGAELKFHGDAGDYTQREVDTEDRSEEHTSELQSRENLVCRLLLEKKKKGKGRRR